jgi:photosystem II stability/assembly factor-like uncharacterized protein
MQLHRTCSMRPQMNLTDYMLLLILLLALLGGCGKTKVSPSPPSAWKVIRSEHFGEEEGKINALDFVDSQNGWALGPQQLLHTGDGGKTWKAHRLTDATIMDFFDKNMGWVVTFRDEEKFDSSGMPQFRTVFDLGITKDGGITWEWKETPLDIWKLTIISENEAWAICGIPHFADTEKEFMSEILAHTNDGGKSWQEVALPLLAANSICLYDIFFLDKDRGWVLGKDNSKIYILRTVDGGKTFALPAGKALLQNPSWRELERNPLKFGTAFYDSNGHIYFKNEQEGWATVNGRSIFRSSDGGKTWQEIIPRFSEPVCIEDCAFPTDKIGWAVGAQAAHAIIIHTTDGGANWQLSWREPISHNRGHRGDISRVIFPDANTGWVLGESGITPSNPPFARRQDMTDFIMKYVPGNPPKNN